MTTGLYIFTTVTAIIVAVCCFIIWILTASSGE